MPTALTPRQEECLRLTRLLTDREIAARLGVAEPTVKKHVLEACQRLGVNRRKAALAILEGLDPETVAEAPAVAMPEVADPLAAIAGSDSASESGARLGYRPPPRDPLFRTVMIAVATVVCAVLITTLTDLVASQHRQVRSIEAATGTLPVAPSRPAEAAS